MKRCSVNNSKRAVEALILAVFLSALLPASLRADSDLGTNFSVSSWVSDLSANITDTDFNKNKFYGFNKPNQLHLIQTDYILYYEVLNHGVSFDLGVSLMNFGGDLNFNTINPENNMRLDIDVPASYARIQLQSPFSDIYSGVETSLFSLGSNSISDYKVYFGRKAKQNIRLEMGYKKFGLGWKKTSPVGDIQIFDGYYTSVSLSF